MTTQPKPTHTPGPWHVITPKLNEADIVSASGMTVATINVMRFDCGANARLIAAAPEMLEALNLAADDLHMVLRRLEVERQEQRDKGERVSIMGAHLDDMWKRLEAIRAAIAKATGAQS